MKRTNLSIICLVLLLFLVFAPASACTCPKTYSSITEKENLIRNQTTEQAYVFWGDQEVEWVQGDSNSFWIPDINILHGATLLHNHPEGCINGFSYQDLKLAYNGHVDDMIVVTPCGMWETKKPFKVWNYTEWKS